MIREVASFYTMAENVASTLFADLKAGRIPAINIDVIRERCRIGLSGRRLTPADFERLESLVLRRVVEMVG